MKRFSLLVTVGALALGFGQFHLQADEGKANVKSIFNGKDLSGWDGNMDLWSVEDGAITGRTKPSEADPSKGDVKHNTFLIWRDGKVGDFELTFKYRIVAGNSGVQYRSKELGSGESGPVLGGYQADFEAGTKYSGILYEEKGRGILAERGQQTVIKPQEKDPADPKSKAFKVEVTGTVGVSEEIQASIKSEDWNDYKIVAKGNHVQHFINGLKTVDVTDEDVANAPVEGLLGFQIHVGPPMVVQFKEVMLKEGK
jgi:hypothetical protein